MDAARFARGFILPVVLILASIVSMMLGYDLQKFVHHHKMHSIETGKRYTLLLMETATLQFFEEISLLQKDYACLVTRTCDQVLLHTEEFNLNGDLFQIQIQLSPCSLIPETCQKRQDLFGVLEIKGQWQQQISKTPPLSWTRFAFVYSREKNETLLQATALVEAL